MKKIISLTRVFIEQFYQNLPIFDEKKRKFNKKSMFFWLLAIIFIAIGYLSYQIVRFLIDIGQTEIFLNIYLPVMVVILSFQAILVCTNVFFFSKDMKIVLHMPIKPIELLISKFFTLLSMLYIVEGIFAVIPITLYGFLSNANFMFFFWEIIVLIIFPIMIVAIVSICTLILMRFGRFIKNKDVFQFVITVILLTSVFLLEFQVIQNLFGVGETEKELVNFSEKAQEINKYLLVVNPSVKMLSNPLSLEAIMSLGKLIIYDLIGILFFIFIGKFTYLKDVLSNMISNQKKKHIKTKIKGNCRKFGIGKSYIIKELKLLIKEPTFSMQCVFPVVAIMISSIILLMILNPIIVQVLQDESIKEELNNLDFNAEILCYILIVLQVLFSISNISLTAVSREGKNATMVKYLPVDLYKQFLYKNVPQIFLNIIVTVIVLGIVLVYIPMIKLEFGYVLAIFLIATIINFINSYLMLIVDLRRPNLDWDTEYSVVKKNNNKIFQYALMIVNVLVLMYIAKIFGNVNIWVVFVGEFLIYFILFMIIDRCVNKWKKKLFNKVI